MITKRQIASKFNCEMLDIEQIGAKQLFVIKVNKRCLLVSYLTIVGEFKQTDTVGFCWHLTKYKCSVTTTKQLNSFTKDKTNVIWVNEELSQ